VTIAWLGNNQRALRWVFQTSRSMCNMDSVSGRARSLLPLPITRSNNCLESTAVTGSLIASPMRNP